METSYIYRLIGIKTDGSDDIIDIQASSETEAEIIIESFHDGDYCLMSESDDYSFLGEFAHQITNPQYSIADLQARIERAKARQSDTNDSELWYELSSQIANLEHDIEDLRSEQLAAWASQHPDHSTIGDMLEGYR